MQEILAFLQKTAVLAKQVTKAHWLISILNAYCVGPLHIGDFSELLYYTQLFHRSPLHYFKSKVQVKGVSTFNWYFSPVLV